MPRGIVPVATLLIIASVFSQFGGSPAPALLNSSQALPSGVPGTPHALPSARSKTTPGQPETDMCTDLSPCLPRSDMGPWTASCDFFAAHPRSPLVSVDLGSPVPLQLPALAASDDVQPVPPSPTVAAQAKKSEAPELSRWCLNPDSPTQFSVTSLIVTLPDPVKSHLVLDFDRRIDAIQAAALDAGYVMDKFWLPWDDSPLPDDPNQARAENILRRLRMNQPGVQIFRSVSGQKQVPLLFVFFVGETTTLGVNRAQLKNAIDYVIQIDIKMHGSFLSHRIPIVGPGFSGAIPSFIEVLNSGHFWQAPQPSVDAPFFDIVPSTATDPGLLRQLNGAINSFGGNVRAIVHDDETTLSRFQTYAHDYLKVEDREIALISESETAFGKRGQDTSLVSPSPPSHVLHMFFPREIYRLRSAYPDQAHPSAGSTQPSAPPAVGLPLNTQLVAGGEDDIPSFSHAELPQSQEAIMLAIAETIHRRKIKLVGVAASDIFDTLFVLRFLKQFCPDTRLFLLDADLLLVRSADDLSLAGTLAVTEFPLSSSARSWFDHSSDLRLFPSRSAEANYNAFLALIGETSRLKDYAPCMRRASNGDLEQCPQHQPLLWLTVVSRNGFQPVYIMPPQADSPGETFPLKFVEPPGTAPAFAPDHPTGAYLLLCTILILLSLLQFLAQSFALKTPADPTQAAQPLRGLLEFFYLPPGSLIEDQKAFFLSTAFVIVANADFIVFAPTWWCTPYWVYRADLPFSSSCWYLLLFTLDAAALSLALIGAFRAMHKHLAASGKNFTAIWLMWLLALLFYGVWSVFLEGSKLGTSSFFLDRCMDIANGISPLLPYLLLLAAFYVWCLRNLQRIQLWDTRRPDLALPSLDLFLNSRFCDLEQSLRHSLVAKFFSKGRRLALAAVVAALLMFRPFTSIAGFEPFKLPFYNVPFKLYDVLFVVFLLVMTTCLLTSLLRFSFCWSALLTILRRLERQPLREAFDRLPKKFYSWTPLWHSLGTRRSFAVETRSLECLRKLATYPEAHDLMNWQVQLSDAQSALLNAESQNAMYLEPQYRRCQAVLNWAANDIVQYILIPQWQRTGACESIDYHDKKESEKPDRGLRYPHVDGQPEEDSLMVVAEEFVALRFVSFIRYVGVQLRNLLSLVTVFFILCVAAVRSYPFLAHRTIGWALTLIFIVLGAPVIMAFAQMDKDAILSRLSDTEPGKLDRAFYVRVVSYGALPLITVLASQFPAIGRFLFSWVQPAIETLH